jgi:NPCBM/NEW2 domain-containing protein/chitobiase/beta-hexosaminidase-like protein
MIRHAIIFALCIIGAPVAAAGQTERGAIDFPLRTRIDKQPVERREKIDPRHVGIVVIDLWDYHWCMTCAQRVASMTPRMNRAFDGARQLGMQIIFAPTTGVVPYQDWPQRKAVKSISDYDWPALSDVKLIAGGGCGGPCMCGPGIDCKLNYGMKAMCPSLRIDDRDLIVWGSREMYNICKERGLTHLIYAGTATNMCVVGKPEAAGTMSRLGLNCIVSRDLTDPFGYPPAQAQKGSIEFIESQGVPSIDVIDMLREQKLWDESVPVDPVEIRPWGKINCPYFFDDKTQVYLEQPRQPGLEIRYTTDGSEPGVKSALYHDSVELTATTLLRAQAFRDGHSVGLPSDAYFVKRLPKPPRPDLRLWEIEPLEVHKAADSKDGELDAPLTAWGLQIRETKYLRGIAMHAPANVVYEIKPQYQRFVALAGVDDMILSRNLGETLAAYPSVVFKIYVDDKLIVESPVMRISQPPWNFDVPLPEGSKRLKLEVTDAGDGSRLDQALWPESGFVIPDYNGPRNVP